ncbi:MAG: hypothetical protein CBC32_000255 [Proteobacteria bacterium TMED72]|nr:hypothetical protein [bacterium]RPG14473.1 MAG: hypothetical protein CBC32_000255 [Proteobacteria bacterium TMED72]RPG17984.1 MAG: hypothetical protein CBB69_006795 [Phycisphaera sp. TMED9]
MTAINALMSELIDFAGLFPPASLDMGATVRGFAAYRECASSDALGRLIVPVSRFDEFEAECVGLMPRVPDLDGNEEDPDPWAISALMSPANDLDAVAADLAAIEAFNERHTEEGAGAAIVDTIEIAAANGEEIDGVLDLLEDDLYPYFELDWRGDVRGGIAAIAGLDGGAKIRTGGVTKDAHPGVLEVTRFIQACRMAEVPFKATAGLHHPVRAHQASVDARQFGFLNVILGAAMLHAGAISGSELGEMLAEEDPNAFTFEETTAGWRLHRIEMEALLEARSRFAHSFGSCSFVEPLEDLAALGMLADAGTQSTQDGESGT